MDDKIAEESEQEIAGLKAKLSEAAPRGGRRNKMDANESFEKAAECFYKATGMLMPGKDICAAMGWTEEREEERQKMFKVWCAAIKYMRSSLAKHNAEERRKVWEEAADMLNRQSNEVELVRAMRVKASAQGKGE